MLKNFYPIRIVAPQLHYFDRVFYFMKNENEELGMFVLFPTEYLEHMTARQAVLMGMLIGMAKKSGYAYPSNKTIGTILNMTTITVQRELAILEQGGFLTRELIRDESMQIIARRIYPNIKTDMGVISKLRGGVISDLIPPSYQNCNSNKDNTISINNKSIHEFEHFWNLYQKKGVRATAQKAFGKLRNDEKELLLTFIPKYIQNHEDAGKKEFIPHFSTFLNQKRWNDELPYQKINVIEPKQQTQKTFNIADYE